MSDFLVVLCTAGSAEEAEHLATTVLQEHLAACVSILPRVVSHYWWQGSLERSEEHLLVIKTTQARLPLLTTSLKSAHSYSVPEILALPVLAGDPDYLAWITAQTSSDQTTGR